MSRLNDRDPLTVLHGDDLPVAPDPAFAARLRARLESALSLPNGTEGVTMSCPISRSWAPGTRSPGTSMRSAPSWWVIRS
jgi:hypothetical protein